MNTEKRGASVTIERLWKPTSPAAIRHLEGMLGATLPADYRAFLLRHNGGMPTPDLIHIDGLIGSPTDVSEFLGLGEAKDASNILWWLKELPGAVMPNSIPIAGDSGGNLFLLSVDGPWPRRVSYVDEENVVFYVAPSFDQFLSMLRDDVTLRTP